MGDSLIVSEIERLERANKRRTLVTVTVLLTIGLLLLTVYARNVLRAAAEAEQAHRQYQAAESDLQAASTQAAVAEQEMADAMERLRAEEDRAEQLEREFQVAITREREDAREDALNAVVGLIRNDPFALAALKQPDITADIVNSAMAQASALERESLESRRAIEMESLALRQENAQLNKRLQERALALERAAVRAETMEREIERLASEVQRLESAAATETKAPAQKAREPTVDVQPARDGSGKAWMIRTAAFAAGLLVGIATD